MTKGPRLDAKAIGQRIRELRRKRGWYQRHLAARSGVHRALIGLFETGARVPRLEAGIALAMVFRRSLEWLYFGQARRGQLYRLAR